MVLPLPVPPRWLLPDDPDTPEKIAVVRELLQKYSGVTDPELRIEVVPWAMTHGVVGKEQALRDCAACHGNKSILARPVDLNSSLPKGVPVMYRGKQLNVVNFQTPEPSFDNRLLLNSFYIVGYSRVRWIEWLGWLCVIGAAVGHPYKSVTRHDHGLSCSAGMTRFLLAAIRRLNARP